MNLYRLTDTDFSNILRIKEYLHAHPELSLHEHKTTALIKDFLTCLNIELLDTGKPTGAVGLIRGHDSSKVIALRADIDALPYQEEPADYPISSVPNVMHGCGHDFHTACLLGAALLLSRQKPPFDVMLVFQHAEELNFGARDLISSGFFEKHPFDAMYGLHNRTEIPAGKVVVKEGPLMSAKDNIRIKIHGKGGHSSMPEKCKDTILASAATITALNTIVSRNIAPLDTAVLTICSINGGNENNHPVDEVIITGSLRSYTDEVRDILMSRIGDIVKHVPMAYGCTGEFELINHGPAIINSNEMYRRAKIIAHKAMGDDCIMESNPCLASEDFSEYSVIAPTFFYWLGSGYMDKQNFPWHSNRFSTNNEALRYGSELLAYCGFLGLT
ncbi:MAG: amidohydrolase [Clostridia bacterium]|nr:amidohydrolase [Clostridia bacterium]